MCTHRGGRTIKNNVYISGGDTGVGTNGADGLCGDIRDDATIL